MRIQPIVRVILTAIAAGLGAAAATVDNETVRIIAAIGIPVLAAVGIIPPQVPARTSIDATRQPVNVVRDEGGQGSLWTVFVVLAIVVLVVLLVSLVDIDVR